jgi:WD repeat and SOF domain-containing protein 1
MHDLANRRILLRRQGAHKQSVTGLAFADSERLLSCGVDQTVKLWDVRTSDNRGDEEEEDGPSNVPLNVYRGKAAFK